MSPPDILYPIPRDPDPASKIDIGALKAWWTQQDEDHSIIDLIADVKFTWPATLPNESWYIAVYATLITCGKPGTIVPIFKHLVKDATTVDEVKVLGDKFKAVLMKLWIIIGIVLPVVAFPSLARAEHAAVVALESELDDDATRARLNAFISVDDQMKESIYRSQDIGPAIEQRGLDFILKIYRHNLPAIMGSWSRHQIDVEWLEINVVYGLFLSDFSVLSDVEVEIGVLAAIMTQDIAGPTYWHIRGTQRLGVSKDDTDIILNAVKKCAAWAGRELKETGNLTAKDVDIEWDPVASA